MARKDGSGLIGGSVRNLSRFFRGGFDVLHKRAETVFYMGDRRSRLYLGGVDAILNRDRGDVLSCPEGSGKG